MDPITLLVDRMLALQGNIVIYGVCAVAGAILVGLKFNLPVADCCKVVVHFVVNDDIEL